MTLYLRRNPENVGKPGCSDDWIASIEGLPRMGIGKNRTEAVGSLVGANLEAFGIVHRIDEDSKGDPVVVEWHAAEVSAEPVK